MNGYVSNLSQIALCRRVTCSDGRESGVKLIELDNGILSCELLESNALDIGRLCYRGRNVAFISRNGYDNFARGFERRFCGGMLYTCGPESIGAREGFEMHGSLHGTPAVVVAAGADLQGNICVTGYTDYTGFFGNHLRLTRTVNLKSGAGCLEISDCLENLGFTQEDYCLLYHVNFGYPFLDGNSYVELDALSTEPRDKFAAQYMRTCESMLPPEAGRAEAVYFRKLNAPRAAVVSPVSGLRAELTYSGDTLPCLTQWNCMRSGAYALGLEPCTCFLDDKFSYSRIAAGQKIFNTLKLNFTELQR